VNSNDQYNVNNGTASKVIHYDNNNHESDGDKNRKNIKSNFEIYDDIINDEQDYLLEPLLSDEDESQGVFGMIDQSTKIGNVFILRCCKMIKKQTTLMIKKQTRTKENEEDWSRYASR
jgi:hypothetical protein